MLGERWLASGGAIARLPEHFRSYTDYLYSLTARCARGKINQITRCDDEIIDFMADAMLEEINDAQQRLDRLASE